MTLRTLDNSSAAHGSLCILISFGRICLLYTYGRLSSHQSTCSSDLGIDQISIIRYPNENDSQSTNNRLPHTRLIGPSLLWNYFISEHWSSRRHFPLTPRCVDYLAVTFHGYIFGTHAYSLLLEFLSGGRLFSAYQVLALNLVGPPS
jgi:hypothetical protein